MATIAQSAEAMQGPAAAGGFLRSALFAARRIGGSGLGLPRRRLQVLPDYLMDDVGVSRREADRAREFRRASQSGDPRRFVY